MIVLLRVILLIIVIFVLVRFLSFKKSSEENGVKDFTGTPQPIILLDNSNNYWYYNIWNISFCLLQIKKLISKNRYIKDKKAKDDSKD